MKTLIIYFAVLILTGFLSEQSALCQSNVEPTVLIAALPVSGPAGFQKGEVIVTQTSPAQVSLVFNKLIKKGEGGEYGGPDQTQSIVVSINDETGNSEFTLLMIAPERNDEKAIKVKGKYTGKESVYKNDYGCVESNMVFLINERFLVEIKGNKICDIAVLYQIVDKMKTETLPL
jgi:hypothetical protein